MIKDYGRVLGNPQSVFDFWVFILLAHWDRIGESIVYLAVGRHVDFYCGRTPIRKQRLPDVHYGQRNG